MVMMSVGGDDGGDDNDCNDGDHVNDDYGDDGEDNVGGGDDQKLTIIRACPWYSTGHVITVVGVNLRTIDDDYGGDDNGDNNNNNNGDESADYDDHDNGHDFKSIQ